MGFWREGEQKLPQKNLSPFGAKCWYALTELRPLLLVTQLWDTTLTPPHPFIGSCSFNFWTCSCIARNFYHGERADHKRKIMVPSLNYFWTHSWPAKLGPVTCERTTFSRLEMFGNLTICFLCYDVGNCLGSQHVLWLVAVACIDYPNDHTKHSSSCWYSLFSERFLKWRLTNINTKKAAKRISTSIKGRKRL